MITGKRKKNLVDKLYWGRRALDVQEKDPDIFEERCQCQLFGRFFKRNVLGSQTDRFITCVNSTSSVVGGPSCWILKQSNRPDLTLSAEIEPVPGSPGHAYQITCFDFQRHYRTVFGSDMKQAPAGNDETHLVWDASVNYSAVSSRGIYWGPRQTGS